MNGNGAGMIEVQRSLTEENQSRFCDALKKNLEAIAACCG
jgi:hypothetical protein